MGRREWHHAGFRGGCLTTAFGEIYIRHAIPLLHAVTLRTSGNEESQSRPSSSAIAADFSLSKSPSIATRALPPRVQHKDCHPGRNFWKPRRRFSALDISCRRARPRKHQLPPETRSTSSTTSSTTLCPRSSMSSAATLQSRASSTWPTASSLTTTQTP